jgi:4-oxalocrotonate tautomerase
MGPSDHTPPHTGRADAASVPQRAALPEEDTVPLIQVKLVEGVFNAEEKQQIIEKLTDAMVSVEGEAMRPVTWVTLEDVPSGEWGIGGKGMTTADILALRGAVPA